MLRKIIKNIVDYGILLESLFVKQEVHSKKRVLLFRKDVLGDFVIFLPTLNYYREFYKDYEISLVVSDMCIGLAPLFNYMDDVIVFNQKKFRTSFWYRRSFIRGLAKKGFDIAIYPVYSSETIGDLMMKATRAREILDFKTVSIDPILNELDKNMAFVSKVTRKTCIAKFPTINTSILGYDEFIHVNAKHNLDTSKYVVMVPGSSATYKMWPLEKMATIAHYLVEKGYKVVLLGSKNEKILGETIIQLAKNKDFIINLIGDTQISTLIRIVAGAEFYFGNDTGTLHIAAAVSTPSIAIMGGGHFKRFFPYGDLERNRIVFDKHMKCKNDGWECTKIVPLGAPSPCIAHISVEDAKSEIDDLVSKMDYNNKQ